MKFLVAFGLTVILFLVTLTNNQTPTVKAQGPTPGQIVQMFLQKGGTETYRGIVTGGKDRAFLGKCEIVIKLTNITSLGYGTELAAKYIGMQELEFLNAVDASTLRNGGDLFVSIYLDPEFCNPPSGTSPAMNPVPDPSPHSTHGDPIVYGAIALAALAGFLFFPPFRRVFVRI